jgi:ribosomal protein S14
MVYIKPFDPSWLRYEQVNHFWAKVSQFPEEDVCWPWIGRLSEQGYGVWRPTLDRVPTTYPAHRVAYALWKKIVLPADKMVLHHCDNPPCCNPKHLFLGTSQDNVDDCMAKGRRNHVFGPTHPKTSLTEQAVREIRECRKDGATDGQLAEAFGVSRHVINQLLNGRSYKWVQ